MRVCSSWGAWVLSLMLSVGACAPDSSVRGAAAGTAYQASEMCRGCHTDIYQQYRESMHSSAFSNPVFHAQYFSEVVPMARETPEHASEAGGCVACHNPVAFILHEGEVPLDRPPSGDMDDVSCDFCHTMTGHEGDVPGDGRYISIPSDLKLGPFKVATNWHRKYSAFHRRSEFCGTCHNDTNHNGLEIKSTYTEWRRSSYAQKGVQCQDCHMNVQGFLRQGKAIFRGGEAAQMTLGTAPERERLYTHRFPGAHSRSQIAGALMLRIRSDQKNTAQGENLFLHVDVNNSRSGHRMPSGSADLRLMWLEVKVSVDGGPDVLIPAAAPSRKEECFENAGAGTFDGAVLGDQVPEGCRVYRAIFVDAEGRQTFASYDAVDIIFDNRLEAGEIRKERYGYTIPEGANRSVRVTASLNYLPYPKPFAEKLGIREAAVVEVAKAEREFVLHH